MMKVIKIADIEPLLERYEILTVSPPCRFYADKIAFYVDKIAETRNALLAGWIAYVVLTSGPDSHELTKDCLTARFGELLTREPTIVKRGGAFFLEA